MGRYILVEREAFCGFAAQSVVDGVVAAVPSRKSYLHAREDTPLQLCGGITSVLSHYLGTGQSPSLHQEFQLEGRPLCRPIILCVEAAVPSRNLSRMRVRTRASTTFPSCCSHAL